jgi:hypothetical protein
MFAAKQDLQRICRLRAARVVTTTSGSSRS